MAVPGCQQVRLLLVTAHPDDECMFFGPALAAYNSSGSPPNCTTTRHTGLNALCCICGNSRVHCDPGAVVHWLCLSNGDETVFALSEC